MRRERSSNGIATFACASPGRPEPCDWPPLRQLDQRRCSCDQLLSLALHADLAAQLTLKANREVNIGVLGQSITANCMTALGADGRARCSSGRSGGDRYDRSEINELFSAASASAAAASAAASREHGWPSGGNCNATAVLGGAR